METDQTVQEACPPPSSFSATQGSTEPDSTAVPSAAGPSTHSHYGGVNPEDDGNIEFLHYVSEENLRFYTTDRTKMLDSSSDEYYPAGECEFRRGL
jgi:hypothetical protein